ncbi:MAG: hypothetical protein P8Y38_01315 [Deltaproteobacteria bacterium]
MGEVKSTLDLVMERTRHLSLSEDERDRQKRTDFEKRLQGLLLRYAEDAIKPNELHQHIASLQTEMKIRDEKLLLDAVFKRIDPDADNGRWMSLLADSVPEALSSLKQILAHYHRKRNDLLAAGGRRVQKRLDEQHAIRGSAVVPNAEKDSQYVEQVDRLKAEVQSGIDAIADHC